MKRDKKNIIYVDFTFTKKKIKSKTLIILYKVTFSLIKILPLPKYNISSKRLNNDIKRNTANY